MWAVHLLSASNIHLGFVAERYSTIRIIFLILRCRHCDKSTIQKYFTIDCYYFVHQPIIFIRFLVS